MTKKKTEQTISRIAGTKNFFKKLFRRKIFWALSLSFVILIIISFYLFQDLPSPSQLKDARNFPSSTLIYDRQGKLLYEIYADKNRVPVTLEELPDYLKKATIASEDKNFYSHHGFDFGGIFRAIYNTSFKGTLQGGSTITQQLVKNALLSPDRTIKRKIREAVLTLVTEIVYSKDEILQMYFNQVPYGGTAWGVEAAAQTYFDKNAQDLSLAEGALLSGLPVSPTRYSPFGAHPELAKERQKRVLDRMVEDGYLSQEEADQAFDEELNYANSGTNINAPHFVLWVKELLVEEFGEHLVEQGGLKVHTTLDLDLQNFAQTTVASEVAQLKSKKISNGAALVTNPGTGEILSMIGSEDYFDDDIDGKVNVTLRQRQPGSSIKPLNYALGLEKGVITLSTVLNDVSSCFLVEGQKAYCPVNYDNQFHGPVQARFALGNSFNIPAVKVLVLNGLTDFVDKATEMGITTFKNPDNYGLSLTLGGGEVKMVDMATAFSAFANLGIKQEIWAIERVVNLKGEEVFKHQTKEAPRVLKMETAYLINHVLLDNNARSAAFGSSSSLRVKNHPEVSVKTGTTNDLRDNWTIGWTPSVLVVTWVGNNDNSPMSYVVSGVTGASPIWNEIISHALKDKKESWPPKPENVVGRQVCALSGFLPNPDNPCPTRFEYFDQDNLPNLENLKASVEIDKTTNELVTKDTLPENKELQEKQVIYDPLNSPFCLDCTFPTQAQTIYPSQINPPSETKQLDESEE